MKKSVVKSFVTFLFIFSLAICFGGWFSVRDERDVVMASAEEEYAEDSSVVLSYMDVFQSYYDYAEEIVVADGGTMCSFEEFCDKYYASGYDIVEYTETVIRTLTEDEGGSAETDVEADPASSLSSSDADYILSATTYDTTPHSEFERDPLYGAFVYDVIKKGDIIYETDTVLFDSGHSAIIYDTAKDSYYGEYIQTIEAVTGGVQYGFLDDTRILDYGVLILRVLGATGTVIEEACEFCYKQLGEFYSFNSFRLNTSDSDSKWYCSELVYAAYYNAGIDIGVTKDSSGNDVYLSLGCLPSDIYESYNTYEVAVEDYFLSVSVVGKSGSTWRIKTENNYTSAITCYYNSKMCFKNDAINWENLDDVTAVSISAGSSRTLSVSTNWFATTVAFSFIHNGARVITYGYELDSSDKTMTVGYNVM